MSKPTVINRTIGGIEYRLEIAPFGNGRAELEYSIGGERVPATDFEAALTFHRTAALVALSEAFEPKYKLLERLRGHED